MSRNMKSPDTPLYNISSLFIWMYLYQGKEGAMEECVVKHLHLVANSLIQWTEQFFPRQLSFSDNLKKIIHYPFPELGWSQSLADGQT